METLPRIKQWKSIFSEFLRRTVLVNTDAEGNFIAEFDPLTTESGHYRIGASFPGIQANTVQDEFDILGLNINGGQYVLLPVILGDTLHGSFTVTNKTGLTLHDLTFNPISLPAGANLNVPGLT